jgi:nitroreductase
MDTITDIRAIRVVRRYRPEPLSEDEVRAIADTARKAASSKNTQKWAFVTVRDPDRLAELGDVGYYSSHLPSAGAAIALVVPKPNPDHARSILWDLGRAAQNIVLAAWAMGIGSCPITVHRFDLAARVLGLPDDQQCEYIIALGWPADPEDLTRPSKAGGRKDYDEVIHEEQW